MLSTYLDEVEHSNVIPKFNNFETSTSVQLDQCDIGKSMYRVFVHSEIMTRNNWFRKRKGYCS